MQDVWLSVLMFLLNLYVFNDINLHSIINRFQKLVRYMNGDYCSVIMKMMYSLCQDGRYGKGTLPINIKIGIWTKGT